MHCVIFQEEWHCSYLLCCHTQRRMDYFQLESNVYFIAYLGFLVAAGDEAQLPQCLVDNVQDYP